MEQTNTPRSVAEYLGFGPTPPPPPPFRIETATPADLAARVAAKIRVDHIADKKVSATPFADFLDMYVDLDAIFGTVRRHDYEADEGLSYEERVAKADVLIADARERGQERIAAARIAEVAENKRWDAATAALKVAEKVLDVVRKTSP